MSDELPGGYDTVEGIKKRCEALGSRDYAELVRRAEDRVYYDEDPDGYRIANPDKDVDDIEFTFQLGVLTGAALEREYPAPDDV